MGRHLKPVHCLRIVPRHTLTILAHKAYNARRYCAILRVRPEVTAARMIGPANAALRICMSLVSGLEEPLHGCLVILVDSTTVLVHLAKCILGVLVSEPGVHHRLGKVPSAGK